MAQNIIGIATRNRSDLEYYNKYTIQFYKLYPNFDIWKADCVKFGIPEDKVMEVTYNIIMDIGGGVFLRWNEGTQARTALMLEWRRLLKLYERRVKIWNMDIDELLKNGNEQRAYSTGENDESENRKYLAAVTQSDMSPSIASNYANLDFLLSTQQDPEQWLIITFLNNIALPIMPKEYNWDKDKGDYNAKF